MVLHPDVAERRGKPSRVRVPLEDADGEPAILRATLLRTVGDCILVLHVTGCRFHQPALARLAASHPRRGFPCVLIREPHNPFDERAIAVWTRGGRCGYIPRAQNPAMLGPLRALEEEHGLPIALHGELYAGDFGLAIVVEVPEVIEDAPHL